MRHAFSVWCEWWGEGGKKRMAWCLWNRLTSIKKIPTFAKKIHTLYLSYNWSYLIIHCHVEAGRQHWEKHTNEESWLPGFKTETYCSLAVRVWEMQITSLTPSFLLFVKKNLLSYFHRISRQLQIKQCMQTFSINTNYYKIYTLKYFVNCNKYTKMLCP